MILTIKINLGFIILLVIGNIYYPIDDKSYYMFFSFFLTGSHNYLDKL